MNPAVISRAQALRLEFDGAQPFRHLVIDDFLDPQLCAELAAQFPAFDRDAAKNELGEVGGKAVFSNVSALGPAYERFDQLMKDPEFLAFTSSITGIPDVLYDPDYEGGGTHENLSGQELDTHVDFNYHPRTATHRRLNLIVFLNPEWRPEWGGCLELLRDPWATGGDGFRSVAPLMNRAVLFETSEKSWHGFRKIEKPNARELSRRSLAVYFYTKQRPESETAPAHATIYFQRPLPEHIRAGYTLTEDDVTQLQTLMTRRDHYMKFLYERELEFSATLHNVVNGRSYRIYQKLVRPIRALVGK